VYTLEDIMEQAMQDEYAVNLSGDGFTSKLLYGCKISKDHETKRIELLNTSKGGEWYSSVDDESLEVFLEKGWRVGVYVLSLSNYRAKLEKVEQSIKKEMNGRKNPKQIQSLKTARQNIMERYSKINFKLNQISNGKIKNRKHQG